MSAFPEKTQLDALTDTLNELEDALEEWRSTQISASDAIAENLRKTQDQIQVQVLVQEQVLKEEKARAKKKAKDIPGAEESAKLLKQALEDVMK